MRRFFPNSPQTYEISNEFVGKIRNFGMLKVRRHWVCIEYKDQDLNYIYATLEIDGKYVCHISIDHRYRNKRFKIVLPYGLDQFYNPYNFTLEAKKKYIDLALKAIEDKTGWRRIGPDK